MTREEKVKRLRECKKDLALCREALRDIASGKRKQSYGVGTRNASAHSMNLNDLREWEKALKKEIEELEATLEGKRLRYHYKFRPAW